MMMMILLLLSLEGDLVLKRQVEVSKAVFLSDLLTSESYRKLSNNGVKNIRLSGAPDIRQKEVFHRDAVTEAIQKQNPGMKLSWKGPSSILVGRRKGDFDSSQAEDAIREWVEQLETPLGQVFVDQVFVPNLSLVPEGEISFQVRKRNNFQTFGRQSLWLDVSIAGKPFKTLAVQAALSTEMLVGKVKMDVERDSPLDESMVDWNYERVSNYSNMPVTPDQLQDMSARSVIRAGQTLTSRLLKPIDVVRRGEPVTVIAKADALTITMRAIAQTNGGYGQRVTVKNPDTGRSFSGLVERDGFVHIDLN